MASPYDSHSGESKTCMVKPCRCFSGEKHKLYTMQQEPKKEPVRSAGFEISVLCWYHLHSLATWTITGPLQVEVPHHKVLATWGVFQCFIGFPASALDPSPVWMQLIIWRYGDKYRSRHNSTIVQASNVNTFLCDGRKEHQFCVLDLRIKKRTAESGIGGPWDCQRFQDFWLCSNPLLVSGYLGRFPLLYSTYSLNPTLFVPTSIYIKMSTFNFNFYVHIHVYFYSA